VARGSGAGGAAAGREPGGEISRALREHRRVPASTEDAPTAEAGESAETSTESSTQLDERFRSAQESTLGGDPGGGEGPGPAGHGVGGGGVFGRLTSVALRAPSVSRPKEKAELSTLLRLGTFYFALTRHHGQVSLDCNLLILAQTMAFGLAFYGTVNASSSNTDLGLYKALIALC